MLVVFYLTVSWDLQPKQGTTDVSLFLCSSESYRWGKGPGIVLCQLKKPFKGPRRRLESCWKERNRIIFPQQGVIFLSSLSMIFYKKETEKNWVSDQTWGTLGLSWRTGSQSTTGGIWPRRQGSSDPASQTSPFYHQVSSLTCTFFTWLSRQMWWIGYFLHSLRNSRLFVT